MLGTFPHEIVENFLQELGDINILRLKLTSSECNSTVNMVESSDSYWRRRFEARVFRTCDYPVSGWKGIYIVFMSMHSPHTLDALCNAVTVCLSSHDQLRLPVLGDMEDNVLEELALRRKEVVVHALRAPTPDFLYQCVAFWYLTDRELYAWAITKVERLDELERHTYDRLFINGNVDTLKEFRQQCRGEDRYYMQESTMVHLAKNKNRDVLQLCVEDDLIGPDAWFRGIEVSVQNCDLETLKIICQTYWYDGQRGVCGPTECALAIANCRDSQVTEFGIGLLMDREESLWFAAEANNLVVVTQLLNRRNFVRKECYKIVEAAYDLGYIEVARTILYHSQCLPFHIHKKWIRLAKLIP